jgi:hypothetical protein
MLPSLRVAARRAVLLLALLSFLLYQGCSLFAPSNQMLTISASEPDAEIIVDGQPVGRGSASVSVRRNLSHSIMARVGERTGHAGVGTTISTTGVLDIIGGCLFLLPLLGILGPGFHSLERDTISVYVPPASVSASVPVPAPAPAP